MVIRSIGCTGDRLLLLISSRDVCVLPHAYSACLGVLSASYILVR